MEGGLLRRYWDENLMGPQHVVGRGIKVGNGSQKRDYIALIPK
jgi:hypothetical protein